MFAPSLVRPAARFNEVCTRFNSRSSAAFLRRVSCRQQQQQHTFATLQLNLFNRSSSAPQQKNHLWHRLSSAKSSDCLAPDQSEVSVVLLGWLGAEQRHLRRYAEWYNSRGIHAITFALPMNDLLSLSAVDNAQGHVDSLYSEITSWLSQSCTKERSVIFHTFSNTGWFFYGAILEKLQQLQQETFLLRIKGCVVDSAPVAELNSQVWASGFATAFLKKRSYSTQSAAGEAELQPSMPEALLLASLDRFFAMLLSVPAVKQRLLGVISILKSDQPPCPQLYLYSSADRVIPSSYVESFISKQKKAGYKVSSYDMQFSPHVDHFRNFPALYCGQLQKFLAECFHAKCQESQETETVDSLLSKD